MEQDKGQVIIYQSDGDIKVDVHFEDETVWLTQQQMAMLYKSSRTNVVEHIKNIYAEGELDEKATCRNFRQVGQEGNRQVSRELTYYNLDMIISLGYRIKSDVATRFRIWATARLKEYMQNNKMYMKDYVEHLDRILSSNGDEVLEGAGRISHEQALEKANAEYQKFITQNLSPVEKAYLQTVKCAEREIKANQ